MKGVDVSEFQGHIDWDKLSKSVDFVDIKATYQGTSGRLAADRLFLENATQAKAHNIPFQCYHYGTLDTPDVAGDAAKEAEFFCGLIYGKGDVLLPVLDLEENKSNRSPAQVLEYIVTFMDTVKARLGRQAVLYSYTPFLNTNLPKDHNLGEVPLWIAQYPKVYIPGTSQPHLPDGWLRFYMWQYSNEGKIDGITGNVDLNFKP